MNVFSVAAVLGILVALRFLKRNPLVHGCLWLSAVYVGLRFGIDPPLPASIVSMFTAITALFLIAYLSASRKRLTSVRRQLSAVLLEKRFRFFLVVLTFVVPLLVASKVYTRLGRDPSPPLRARTVHPPPPSRIVFRDSEIDLEKADNPFRSLDTAVADSFRAHVARGKAAYYRNCFFCHGSELDGKGMFSHGLNPLPTNFRDPTTIAMLRESYLFWRIAKGAPGLPAEAAPWNSSMPAWESFLSEQEIWDVILFLYDYTGQSPRSLDTG